MFPTACADFVNSVCEGKANHRGYQRMYPRKKKQQGDDRKEFACKPRTVRQNQTVEYCF